MLKEYPRTQDDPGALKRWFYDGAVDLCVWYDPQGAVAALQMAHRADDLRELALVWRRPGAVRAAYVDDGEATVWHSRAPILLELDRRDAAWVAASERMAAALAPRLPDLPPPARVAVEAVLAASAGDVPAKIDALPGAADNEA